MVDQRDSKRQPDEPSRVTSDLAQRIAAAKRHQAGEQQTTQGVAAGEMSGLGRAVRLGSEFVSAVLVGTVLGYFADQWLGTRPWIMLVMLLIGFGAGVLNVTRAVTQMNKAAPPPPPGSDLGPGDDDDTA